MPFLNVVGDIDHSRAGRRALRSKIEIDIAAASVTVRQSFRVVLQTLWRVDRALLHLDRGAKLVFRRRLETDKPDSADVISNAFIDRDDEGHLPFMAFLANVLDLYVDVTVVLVPLADLVEVLLKLRFIEAA